MSNIKERLDMLRERIQQIDFLEGKGLSNEVNIHIFSYDPREEMTVRHFVDKLTEDDTLNCHLKIYNLYEVFLSICDDKRITDSIPVIEEKKGKAFILKQMHSIATNQMFINKLRYEPHKYGDVVMLTGVGEVFPFMRVHALIDVIQPYFSGVPILIMYPGSYDGSQVKLFNKLKPSRCYRPFNLI